jgi:hypothetical protein
MAERRGHPHDEPAPAVDPGPSEVQPVAETPEEPRPSPESGEAQEDKAQAVEPRLGLREYHAVAAGQHDWTPAVAKAAEAALIRWMRQHGHDQYGYYSQKEWTAFYTAMLVA